MKPLLAGLAVAFVALFIFTPVDVPVNLLFGWCMFLVRVLPQITVDVPSIIVGVLAFLVFAAGIHWAGRSWRRETWKMRWSLSIVAVVFLLFVSGTCLVAVTHQATWLATAHDPLLGTSLKDRWGTTQNNLRQITLSIHNYASAYNGLPAGGTYAADGCMQHGWITAILPFVSYSTREIDMTVPWNHPKNAKYFQCVLPQFINPDFRTAELFDADGYGLSHYAANSHVLGANTKLRIQDISDGTANTLLIGEINANFKPWASPANYRDPARGINKSPHGFGGPPNSGGAQFAMADGSVRFISEKVSPRVLKALATPAGGEEVDMDALAIPR